MAPHLVQVGRRERQTERHFADHLRSAVPVQRGMALQYLGVTLHPLQRTTFEIAAAAGGGRYGMHDLTRRFSNDRSGLTDLNAFENREFAIVVIGVDNLLQRLVPKCPRGV